MSGDLAAQLRLAVDALVKIAARDRYHGLGSVSIARAALRELGLDAEGRRRDA
jgi:hypothetical protein